MAELTPRLLELARAAKSYELNFTVDAEEADRLELSLAVIGAVLRDPSLAGWDGFGLAVQAYQKRAAAVIDWVADMAEALDRRLMVRLVKGAYWDSEVKRAQERGLADYPVFTRKAMTDLCYLDCARKLLRQRPRLYPQFATHNALTVASVIEDAGGEGTYEFQRLHGMGEALYHALLEDMPALTCRVYAPVGGYADLLAYLVRRLLENGANSSFVSVAADPNVPIADILKRPQSWIAAPERARNAHIPLPRDLFAPERRNSAGIEFGERAALDALLGDIGAAPKTAEASPLIDGVAVKGRARDVHSPIDGDFIGTVAEGDEAIVASAMAAAQTGFAAWDATPVAERAAALDARRRPDRAQPRPADRAVAKRRRQDARRLRLGSAGSVRFLPLLRRASAPRAHAQAAAGTDRREQHVALSRARRRRLHQPVEFPARDFHRPDRRRARRRQCGGGETGRADAAHRLRSGAACCMRPACR